MAITAHGTNNSTNGTASATTKSSGTVASCVVDDFVIAAIAIRSNSSSTETGGATVALQSGSTGTVGSFTELSTGGWNGGGGVPVLQWWYARVTGAGSIGITATLPVSRPGEAAVLILRGVPTAGTPVTAVVANGTGSTAGTGPITPVQAADWAVGATCWIGAQAITPTASPTFTEDVEARGALSDTDDRTTLHLEHYAVPDTSTVTSAPTMANSRNWRSAITVVPTTAAGGGFKPWFARGSNVLLQ